MPFHPEELHKSVRALEALDATIDASDANSRIAQAKAIVSATDSLVEGCLMALFRQTLGELGVPTPLAGRLLKLRGLADKLGFAKVLAPLRGGWRVKEDSISKFVEGEPGLRTLRNRIDHGDVVSQADLKLDDIDYFRRTACEYLGQIYDSLGTPRLGWLDWGEHPGDRPRLRNDRAPTNTRRAPFMTRALAAKPWRARTLGVLAPPNQPA